MSSCVSIIYSDLRVFRILPTVPGLLVWHCFKSFPMDELCLCGLKMVVVMVVVAVVDWSPQNHLVEVFFSVWLSFTQASHGRSNYFSSFFPVQPLFVYFFRWNFPKKHGVSAAPLARSHHVFWKIPPKNRQVPRKTASRKTLLKLFWEGG